VTDPPPGRAATDPLPSGGATDPPPGRGAADPPPSRGATDLPARSRGVIALLEQNCTSCMLCARECPDWCIYIDSHKETVQPPSGGRPRQVNVLDRFAIDFALCMYCGICVEVCPFDALFWSPEYEYAAGDVAELTQEREQLREWLGSVPAAAGPASSQPAPG
jgi:NADH-quinone oxidoreductase subunit I